MDGGNCSKTAQRHLVFTVLSVRGKPRELCLSDPRVEHSPFGQFTKTVIINKEGSILVSRSRNPECC